MMSWTWADAAGQYLKALDLHAQYVERGDALAEMTGEALAVLGGRVAALARGTEHERPGTD